MSSIVRQVGAIAAINVFGLPRRLWMSLSTVVAIALLVFVLLSALALDAGFEATLKGTGSSDVAVVTREGASGEGNSSLSHEQQRILASGPGIMRRGDDPLISGELVVLVDGIKQSTGTKANIAMRGIGTRGLDVRDGVTVTAGRMFATGSNEVIVGKGVADTFRGFTLGQTQRIGGDDWRVVGVFDPGSSVTASEIWADIGTVQSRFHRGDAIQSLRLRLTRPADLGALSRYAASDPRLHVDVRSEKAFYDQQAARNSDLITLVGKPIAFVLAIGALAGALNAMYSSVSARAVEISTLRTMGFSRLATFLGTVAEALTLALAGAALGVIGSFVIVNGLSASTRGFGAAQIVFHLTLAPGEIVEAVAWAAIIGVIGGIFPAWRGATRRLSVVND